MKLEMFFEKFDQFVDAPNAVEKMRELVLEFAVRGLLTERNPKDQADAAWCEFIEEFDHRIYCYDPGPPPPFEIPDEWRWVCLDDLGKTKVRNEVADGMRVAFTPMALIPAGYGISAQSEERTWSEVKKGFTHFANGDVVMAKITPCFENGKSAVMRKLLNGVGAGTTELHVFRRGSEAVMPEFVLIYLKTRGFITRGEPRMTGSAGQKRVPHDYFAGAPFPLPPPAEQKRIVAKVDELMALCDRLEAQQQERETRHAALARASLARFADAPTVSNLKFLFHESYSIPPADLRKSILTLAVQGKLVPQDPNDEPAQPAVAQIERERERLIAAKQFRRSQLPGPIDEGPFDIPETWVWTHLGNAMLNVTDGFHSTPKTVESGVRYVTAKHVKPGLIDFDSCLHVSEDDFKEIASKTRPRKGDVLVVNIGAGSGLASIIEADFEFAFKNVAILNRPEEVDSKFLFNYLVFKRDEIFEEQTKGGAQPFLSLGLIRRIPFPLPPLAEQRRIVAKVEQLMALVDALETQLAASRATAANLLSALVAELTSR